MVHDQKASAQEVEMVKDLLAVGNDVEVRSRIGRQLWGPAEERRGAVSSIVSTFGTKRSVGHAYRTVEDCLATTTILQYVGCTDF